MEEETPVLGSLSGNGSSDAAAENKSLQGMPVINTTPQLTENDLEDTIISKDFPDKLAIDASLDGTFETRSSEEKHNIDSVNSDGEGEFVNSVELPSKVMDKEEIFMPVDVIIEDPRIYGKWMVFTNGDFNLHDRMWIELQSLLASGDLILLVSSTAKETAESDSRDRGKPHSASGVIKCYTSEDKEVIKRAGIAIQLIRKDDIILFYKTNQASNDCLYRGFGTRFICSYMLTPTGKLYETDRLDRWKQVTNIKEENLVEGKNSSNSCIPESYHPLRKRRCRSGFGLVPSQETSKTTKYVYPRNALLSNLSGIWSLFCDVIETDQNGTTELDRIWKAVINLCDEGIFTSVSCQTASFRPNPSENIARRAVNCTLNDYCDIDNLIQSGDKLRERTFNLPFYFKVCYRKDKGKPQFQNKYLYTEDRELYVRENEWRLLKRDK